MDWLFRFALLVMSIALGIESAERVMSTMQPPAMKLSEAIAHPSPPPPHPPPPLLPQVDALGGIP